MLTDWAAHFVDLTMELRRLAAERADDEEHFDSIVPELLRLGYSIATRGESNAASALQL